MPSPGRLERLLRHPRALVGILALALLLALPSLTVGFYVDDFSQLAVLEHDGGALRASPLDLYHFVSADRAELRSLITRGPLPWWTDPALELHFFRPLTSALITLDHAVYGRHAVGYHATNILLYLLLVLAVGVFYRRLLPAPAVTPTLAALIFAIDGAHAQPVAWIACRHTLVAAGPAILGLGAHLRHRRDGWRPGAWLGPLGIAVGLLGGEVALGVVAYWLSYDWLGPAPAPRQRAEGAERSARLRASLPVLAIGGAYAVVYKVLGYGAAGSGAYFDPSSSPVDFARALVGRAPALLGDALVGFPSELFNLFPHAPFLAVGVASTAGVAWLLSAVWPAVPADERAALRWLLPAAGGALVLASGGFVGARLLLTPGVGGAFLFAVLLHRGSARVAELGAGPARAGIRVGRGVLGAVHVALAPLVFVGGSLALAELAARAVAVAEAVDLAGPSPRHVVVVAASDPAVAIYSVAVRVKELAAAGNRWNVLSMAKHDHRFTRTGASSFRLTVVGGRMLDGAFERGLRSARAGFQVGDKVALEGGEVTVAMIDEGQPSAIDVRLEVPLEDEHLYLLAWQHGRLARMALPAVGGSVELPWSEGPFGVF